MPTSRNHKSSPPTYDYLACSFQGGGALGAYQVGVLQALQEAGYFPDWFVGTSIGAINSAIAAGNAKEERIDKMRSFWHTIATPSLLDESLLPDDTLSRRLQHFLSSQSAVLFGQPGFFSPAWATPWLNSTKPLLSYYDTSPLRSTLERFVDFDRLNQGKTRLSVGAVEVSSGAIQYFDTQKQHIGPEHIMASGALPPGFPPVEVEGKLYWDGGLSSNSPVSYVLADKHPKALLCFMVHLFDSYGLEPTNLDDVEKRKKDIEYSSRFEKIIEMHHEIHQLRYQLHQVASLVPETKKRHEWIRQCLDNGWDKTVSLVRFLYAGDADDLSSKDYEFSKKSIDEHIQEGYQNGIKALKQSPWLEPVPAETGIAVYDMAKTKKINLT
ncbi:patatin-like phospholipase family protein [Legionella oakridgensis]|uniref:Alpha-beta hydrolase family transporter esterase n=2 Tax=Legionella oakridgensis TaxID=29423 RepID=A0A0W0XHI4_9GAMM|nr:patatin-like phospholipase family protein [Legionella oakridgensis]AHE67808.1 putative esterase of the alpha-beta hydrolase superfamily [Legionella oakridgensis ATCC 33761 = DSM 21215]ETO92612.1 putative esterase of the alpha-beta hydrolase superfamily [Legionella oakridgensis RV-2-2007]KTD44054.1 alpha-beta hydrolase family transporter esterase [Legionella oakridgensis]STY20822.1 transmembrane protein [Legionella longbeachae]